MADDALIELYDGIAARSHRTIMRASRAARDIAPCPDVRDRARRDAAHADLETFLKGYFPRTFSLPWSDDHLAVIGRLQAVVEHGGQFALAMPRGSGKTSLVERAALWAILTGRRRFVVIVAANETMAERSLTRIKAELERNPLLLADWPRECYPIHRLESQSRRCVGQLFDGERTRIVWQRKHLVLPTMPPPDNLGSGAVLHVAGLGAAVRGLSHVTPEGETIRPDLVLCDDPQDRESARSFVQTAERLAVLNGDLLGLAGPGRKIAALTTCTIIRKDDLADRLLDRSKSPSWTGETYRLVYSWPTRDDLWQEYRKLRAEGLRHGGDPDAATEFYRANRAAMDEGAVVAWPERHNPDELSAIQHAWNLRLDAGEAAFASEYQNAPADDPRGASGLDPAAIAGRCGGLPRGTAPPEAEKLTAFIDVGTNLLWYVVCSWDESFGCTILDYGCEPEQRAAVFLSRNASPTLDEVHGRRGGGAAAIHGGLSSLVGRLAGRDWRRSDGASIPLARVVIDAGWGADVVRLFIRQSPRRDLLTPSKGVGIGPGQAAMADYRRRPGERIGDGWILGPAGPDRLRLLRYDANLWKSRVADMLARPMGSPGGAVLFGDRPVEHELIANHLSSEYPTRTEAKGRAVDVWTRRPEAENHLWDCLVGAAVAASLEGMSPLAPLGEKPPAAPVYVRYSEIQRIKLERAEGPRRT